MTLTRTVADHDISSLSKIIISGKHQVYTALRPRAEKPARQALMIFIMYYYAHRSAHLRNIAAGLASDRCKSTVLGAIWWSRLLVMNAWRRWLIYDLSSSCLSRSPGIEVSDCGPGGSFVILACFGRAVNMPVTPVCSLGSFDGLLVPRLVILIGNDRSELE